MLENTFHIGPIKIKNRLVLAPMAGITNLAFRLMAKRLGAGLTVTEMVSAKGLVLDQNKTLSYLTTHPEENPFCVQIFGSEPEVMAQAAEIVCEKGASILDINMGCPVKKVVKTGAGAALLLDPKKTRLILTQVRKAWPRALTIKIRAGWKPGVVLAEEISQLAQDCGVDAISLHPRFASQGFSGHAQWNIISRVKQKVNIPVIGNGDVFRPGDAINMTKSTGCDAVMIGRGAIGNPWIFAQILDMERGNRIKHPSVKERKDFILEHFELLCSDMGQSRAARVMRGLLIWYTKGLPHSTKFRGAIGKINDYETLVATMDEYFNALENRES